MDDDTRSGGRGQVRAPSLADVLKAYGDADCEERCETLLARELALFGWQVERQPWCWGPRIGWRRPDLYATRNSDEYQDVLCIELKHDLSWHSGKMIEAYEQSKDYQRAMLWTSRSGQLLAAPTLYLMSSTALLGRQGKQGTSDRGTVWSQTPPLRRHPQAVGQFEQMAWRSGVNLLYRQTHGDLVTMRHEVDWTKGGEKPRTVQRSWALCKYVQRWGNHARA